MCVGMMRSETYLSSLIYASCFRGATGVFIKQDFSIDKYRISWAFTIDTVIDTACNNPHVTAGDN